MTERTGTFDGRTWRFFEDGHEVLSLNLRKRMPLTWETIGMWFRLMRRSEGRGDYFHRLYIWDFLRKTGHYFETPPLLILDAYEQRRFSTPRTTETLSTRVERLDFHRDVWDVAAAGREAQVLALMELWRADS